MAPIVVIGKDKSYDKSAKRREKSRDAARCRRQQESDTFNEICQAIPVPPKQLAQMDRSTVMRLLISFMKLRNITNHMQFPDDEIKREVSDEMPRDEEYVEALNGFIIVLSHDCDVLFVSTNVKQYIGMSSLDLIGQNLFSYTHEGDHSDITKCLKITPEQSGKHTFFMRMKSTLTSTGKNVNLKSATYKVLKCEGVVHRSPDEDQPYMVAYCEPIPHPANIEMVLDCSTFLSQHSLDMKFTFCDDDRAHKLLGYSEDDMVGLSFYNFCHTGDVKGVDEAMRKLFRLGQVTTHQYRMLTKSGGYVWVVSQATIINNPRNQQPSYVVCVHYVISDIIDESRILSLPQLEFAKANANTLMKQELEEVQELGPQDCTDAIFCDSTDTIFNNIGFDATEVVLSDDATSKLFVPCSESMEVMAKNAPSIGDELDFSQFDFSEMFGINDDLRNNAPSIGDPQWSAPVSRAQEGCKSPSSDVTVNVDRVKHFLKENYVNGDPMTSQFQQPPSVNQPPSVKMRNIRQNHSFSPDSSRSVTPCAPKRKLLSGDYQIVTIPKSQYQQHVHPALDLARDMCLYKVNPPDLPVPVKKQKQHQMFDPDLQNESWKQKIPTGCTSSSKSTDLLFTGKYKFGDTATLTSLLLQPGNNCDNMDFGMDRLEPCRDRDPSWRHMPKVEKASLLPVLSLHDCEVNAPTDDGGSTLDWMTLSAALNGVA